MQYLRRSAIYAGALLALALTTAQAQVRATGYVQGTTVFPKEAPSVVYPRLLAGRADSIPSPTGFSSVARWLPYAPGTYAPGSYAPGTYAPGTYAPGTYAPNTYAPNSYAPNTYSRGTYTPNSYSPGTFTPNTYLSSRVPTPYP